MGDRELAQQLVEHLVALLRVGHGDLEDRPDVVGDGHAAEHRGLLRQVADAELGAAVHRQPGHVLAVDGDRAGIGRHQPGDGVEAGGLAGAVRPEQRRDLAAPQRQRHVAQHRPLAVALGEVADLQARAPLGHAQVGPRGSLARAATAAGMKIVCTRPSSCPVPAVEVDAEPLARQGVAALGQQHVALHLDDARSRPRRWPARPPPPRCRWRG